jgi:hypothetical protein
MYRPTRFSFSFEPELPPCGAMIVHLLLRTVLCASSKKRDSDDLNAYVMPFFYFEIPFHFLLSIKKHALTWFPSAATGKVVGTYKDLFFRKEIPGG